MNKAILMGRLTKDPELRYTNASNTAVCSFTLAIDRRFSKQGEERQSDFIPIVVWGKTAEFCGKYFQKGRQVAVVGRIQTRSWDDAEGKKHYATEVVAEEAYFADSKRDDAGSGGGQSFGAGRQFNPGGATGGQNDGFYPIEDGDDELPF
jgi:single-strand DNA-binding protein